MYIITELRTEIAKLNGQIFNQGIASQQEYWERIKLYNERTRLESKAYWFESVVREHDKNLYYANYLQI